MKNFSAIPGAFLIGLIFISAVYSSPVAAHEVYGPGDNLTHRHVYKRNAFGQGATAGHYAQPAGSRGIVIWQASPSQSYGRGRAGIRIPNLHSRQPSQKQLYQQKPVFSKDQNRTPDFSKK